MRDSSSSSSSSARAILVTAAIACARSRRMGIILKWEKREKIGGKQKWKEGNQSIASLLLLIAIVFLPADHKSTQLTFSLCRASRKSSTSQEKAHNEKNGRRLVIDVDRESTMCVAMYA